ncbi:TonB-dependent receptor [Zhouia spongiae]|uniref:TonB-dependent receptor n=1 Tax=Zhouia spongiae TaxID=2202721 RepID=A0ABY3YMG4_9FLAO|nr:TonB-dependent receptor [Zhouia spongiae]UNY99016.1 TonB-dependent receptor [Zhouia spongiae]
MFKEIESKTEYSFFYNLQDVDLQQKINLNVTNERLDTVLEQLFNNTNVDYKVKRKNIILTRSTRKTTPTLSLSIPTIQAKTISGIVTDENGQPLPGVTVMVQGANKGTSTDFDGNYTVEVNDGDTLSFSYVGYLTQHIDVAGKTVIDVKLQPDIAQLDEIVVIGYGAIKQKNVTGAIGKVDAEDLNVSVASNFQQTLQGKAAGVQVVQPTGQPGAGVSVKIRSNPSFANAGVLYVIDGVPVNDTAGQPSFGDGVGSKYDAPPGAGYAAGGVDKSSLNFINPNDIESIQFLKDASAASIYGARAGAGVVLITTKKGAEGKSTLQYSSNYAIQNADKMYPVFGAKEYMEQRNLLRLEKWYRDNQIAPYYGTVDASTVTPYSPLYSEEEIGNALNRQAATDAITRSGYTQQHNISLSGGNKKTTYFASGNYFEQKGVIIGTDYRRYNGRLNLTHSLSDKIRVGANILLSNSKANNTITGGEFENGGIVTAAIYWAPIQPLRLEDGSYPVSPYYPNIPNPLSYETNTDITKSHRVLSTAFGEWSIVDGLKAKASFSYDQSYSKRSSYFPKTFLYGNQANGSASITESDSQSKLYEYTLNYDKDISAKHHLNTVLGYTYQQTDWSGFNAGNQNFLSDAILYYSLGSGQSDKPTVGSFKNQNTWASYFARAIYTYNDNITLQASIRRDGSSIFAENKKWGYFPAVSAGWIISDEPWLKSIDKISLLKLRAGYGETGNSSFGSAAFEIYNTSLSAYFGTNSVSSGLVLSRAANSNLTWETAGELNVGLDFGLFNNRISGSVDYFNKTIRDLITFVPYPSGFIIDGVYANAGKTRSTGYEISLETRNIVPGSSKGFQWSTNITLSHYLNYWVERSEQALSVLSPYEVEKGKKALFSPIFGYQSNGVFTGEYGTAPSHMPDMLPGGIIIKDIHGYDDEGNLIGPDGAITEADRTYIGNADPDLIFGIGNTFKYKGFDLYVFLSGMKQKKWSPLAGGRATESTMDAFGYNAMPVSAERWNIQNTNGTFPTALYDANYSGYQSGANYWLVDASFIRARNITLGYTFSEDVMKRQNIFSSLKLSFDMQNLFTITNYPGLDPELNSGNFYPLVKSFVFGINASF